MPDLWNQAVEAIAEAFEKKARDAALGYAVTSYETAAALARSYRREEPIPNEAVEMIEGDIRDLRERHDALVEYVLAGFDVPHENRPELRAELQLNAGGE